MNTINNIVVRGDLNGSRATMNAHNFDPHDVETTLDQLDQFVAQGESIDARKHDERVAVQTVRSIGGRLSYPVDGFGLLTPQPITDHAWRQLLGKLSPVVFGTKSGVPNLALEFSGVEEMQQDERGARSMPKRYLERIDTPLLDTILNYHFEHASASRFWQMRSINKPATAPDGEPTDVIRAIVGPRYPVTFGNTELLKTVRAMIGKHQDRFPRINLVRPQLTDDELHMRVVYYERETDDGPYGVGFYLGNNELGLGHYDVMMLIQRGACTNSIIVDRGNSVHVRHVGSAPTIREQVYYAIGAALKLGDDLIDEFLQTREVEIPDFDDVIDGLSLKYGHLLDEQIRGVVKEAARDQGGKTKFGLINGVTYAAHQSPDLTARQRADLEIFGGALIATPNSLFGAAANAWHAHQRGDDPNLSFAVVTLAPRGGAAQAHQNDDSEDD